MAWENLPSTNTPLNATNLNKITDSGSNANGNYIKFQDGTLIQWNDLRDSTIAVDSAYGSLYQAVKTVTFPIPFVGNDPVCTCGRFRWGTGASWGTVSTAGLNDMDLRILDVNQRSSGTTCYISWMAIGRWK